MAKDKNAQMRNLIAGYDDSNRLSDIEALIAGLFVATRDPEPCGVEERNGSTVNYIR